MHITEIAYRLSRVGLHIICMNSAVLRAWKIQVLQFWNFFFLNIFHLWLVEYMDAKPLNIEVQMETI